MSKTAVAESDNVMLLFLLVRAVKTRQLSAYFSGAMALTAQEMDGKHTFLIQK
jgi:hypothetical protein